MCRGIRLGEKGYTFQLIPMSEFSGFSALLSLSRRLVTFGFPVNPIACTEARRPA